MLHITNGDAAGRRIAEAGVPGEILPWRDVLHEGPVPAGLGLEELRPVRAGFLAGCGWAPYEQAAAELERRDATLAGFRQHDETVLWFEPDLYDQLQLLQLLDWFAGQDPQGARLTIVQAGEYLGPARPERLAALFETRRPITANMLHIGASAWRAFTAADPRSLIEIPAGDTSTLPYLAPALRRHLQQFPSTRNGLSRSEEQALAALLDGERTPAQAFMASQAGEEYYFLGDTVFGWYLQRLGNPLHPLVAWSGGEPLPAPGAPIEPDDFHSLRVGLTDLGRAVLSGSADWVSVAGIDRWLGGAHLRTLDHWRWDERTGTLLRQRAESA